VAIRRRWIALRRVRAASVLLAAMAALHCAAAPNATADAAADESAIKQMLVDW
jgi:hypothetical protein